MSTSTLITIGIAVLVALLVFWFVRSRGNTSGHIDTSMTGLGAATEAVEDIVESVTHRFEGALEEDARADAGRGGDAAAMERVSAANMAAAGGPDDLKQLKGVGPKLNSLLVDLGITRFDQIAAWGPKEIETVDAHLGTFKGRITRDNWVEQAGYLAKGDTAGFEAKFGKLNG